MEGPGGCTDIVNGEVKTVDLDNSAVTGGKIAANSVYTGKLASSAVTSTKIANLAVQKADTSVKHRSADQLRSDVAALMGFQNSDGGFRWCWGCGQ